MLKSELATGKERLVNAPGSQQTHWPRHPRPQPRSKGTGRPQSPQSWKLNASKESEKGKRGSAEGTGDVDGQRLGRPGGSRTGFEARAERSHPPTLLVAHLGVTSVLFVLNKNPPGLGQASAFELGWTGGWWRALGYQILAGRDACRGNRVFSAAA